MAMDLDDLPVLKKCCFCVPLRYGLLTWGYLKLAIAVLVLTIFMILAIGLRAFYVRHIFIITIIILIAVILATEIILHIIFIVGAHKKNVKLLKAYYSYAIFMWIVTIIMAFACTSFLVFTIVIDNGPDSNFLITFNVVGFFFSIAVQTFLLISLRSEIIKLRSNCPYRFVKNENDPEGTINSMKEEEIPTDNGTMRIL